jgi:hypothetical protein
MAITDHRLGCHCRGCGLVQSAVATAADNAGTANGDGDTPAENAACNAVYANADEDTACDGHACCSATYGHYDANHAAADIDAAAHGDGYGRGFTWYRTRAGWRYVMEYRLPIL